MIGSNEWKRNEGEKYEETWEDERKKKDEDNL